MGVGEGIVGCLGIFRCGFNLVNEVSERGVGVPWGHHTLFIFEEVNWGDASICSEEVVQDVVERVVVESRMGMAETAEVDGVDGVDELFFEGLVYVVVFAPSALYFSMLTDKFTDLGTSGSVGHDRERGWDRGCLEGGTSDVDVGGRGDDTSEVAVVATAECGWDGGCVGLEEPAEVGEGGVCGETFKLGERLKAVKEGVDGWDVGGHVVGWGK